MTTDVADTAGTGPESDEDCGCAEVTADGGCKIVQLPALKDISGALLRTKEGKTIKAKQLWADAAVLIFGVRRPGCVLCRYEAQQLWSRQEELEAAGVKLVVVVHEWIDTEIAAFTEAAYYWGGDVYLDVDKAFYKAFGNGKIVKGSLLGALNPFNPVWKLIKEANKHVKDSNLKGEALVMGGLLVVRPGKGGVAWMHSEKNYGEFPDTLLVVAEALKAAGKPVPADK